MSDITSGRFSRFFGRKEYGVVLQRKIISFHLDSLDHKEVGPGAGEDQGHPILTVWNPVEKMSHSLNTYTEKFKVPIADISKTEAANLAS